MPKHRPFVLFPGRVYSIRDGEYLFIDAVALARAYRIDLKDCVVVDIRRPFTYVGRTIEGYGLGPRGYHDYEEHLKEVLANPPTVYEF